jgi:hypothetical protein
VLVGLRQWGGTIASGIEWLLLVTIVVAILRAFVWMFTTRCRHLRDHQLHDLEPSQSTRDGCTFGRHLAPILKISAA